jgi:hypothetical protein
MNAKRLIGILLLLGIAYAGQAQRLKQFDLDLEQFMENLFPVQDEDIDYEDIYEILLQYYLNPLNLNKATAEELQSLYVLGPNLIRSLLEYRANYGPFLSVYELQAVPGFSLEVIERILPFVTLEERVDADGNLLQRILKAENKYFISRWERTLETRRGYTPADTLSGGRITSRYAGDPNKLYTRFRASKTGDFSLGFTIEKDPGEQMVWNPQQRQYGFDFISSHAMVQNKGKWESVIVGDYQIQFGQGLLLGAGFNVGKGAETITSIRRAHTGIRPYTSVMEAGFLRGVAATRREGDFYLTAFSSHARRSAGLGEQLPLDDEEGTPELFISSIRESGFHRTPTELAGRMRITERIYGGNITYKAPDGRWMIGGTGMLTDYGLPLQRTPRLYNQFEFRGRQNINAGGYYTVLVDNFNFFGEVAFSSSGGMGMVNGALAGLSNSIELALLHRRYDKNFHSFYGAAFGENTRNINEEGFYMGLRFRPNRRINLAVYGDRFSFPWLRFRADAPSDGYEYLARLSYQPSRNILLFFQAREESKARNVTLPERGMSLVDQGLRRNFIFNIEYGNRENLQLRSRVQWSTYELGSSLTGGMTLVQDLNWQWKKWRLSTRYALFDTDDFDNRQFVFERNVLYAFAIPAYFGRGIRTYAMVQYKADKKTSLWFRWARTRFTDRDRIGSGLEIIEGKLRNDLTAQIIRSF